LLAIELPQKHDASTLYGPIHICSIYVPQGYLLPQLDVLS
jgi:hypothetical protein